MLRLLFLTSILTWASSVQADLFMDQNEKLVSKIIVCSRTIVEKKLAGIDGVEIAGGFLQRAIEVADNTEELAPILDECKVQLEELDKKGIKRETQYELAESLVFSDNVIDLLQNFAMPEVDCNKLGVSFAIVVLAGKADVSACQASNGRQWWQISPGVGMGFGPGVDIGLSVGKYIIEESPYRKTPMSTSVTDVRMGGGIGIAVNAESSKLGLSKEEESEGITAIGIGVGGGWSVMSIGQLDIKFLPRGTDEEYLYEELTGRDI